MNITKVVKNESEMEHFSSESCIFADMGYNSSFIFTIVFIYYIYMIYYI